MGCLVNNKVLVFFIIDVHVRYLRIIFKHRLLLIMLFLLLCLLSSFGFLVILTRPLIFLLLLLIFPAVQNIVDPLFETRAHITHLLLSYYLLQCFSFRVIHVLFSWLGSRVCEILCLFSNKL
jgi:hypothetical protein